MKMISNFIHIFVNFIASITDESKVNTSRSKDANGDDNGSGSATGSGAQQQDWSILWSCFENPLSLLSIHSGLPKGMKEMVCNAVSEMRRYYSRKVIDVLIKVTRSSLDMLRRRFLIDDDDDTKRNVTELKPIFLVYSTLMIPNVAIRPTLDELQEALIHAGRNITGVSKGVAQWSSGKDVNFEAHFSSLGHFKQKEFFASPFFHVYCSHRKVKLGLADVTMPKKSGHDVAKSIAYNLKSGLKCRT